MFNLLSRYRHISLFCFFMLLSLALLSFNRPADTFIKPSNVLERSVLFILQPLQSGISYVVNSFQHVWQRYLALVHLNEENQRLREEIKQIRAEKNLYVERAQAYNRLKGIPDVIENREFSITFARVIGRDSTNQSNIITVDKGSDDVERFELTDQVFTLLSSQYTIKDKFLGDLEEMLRMLNQKHISENVFSELKSIEDKNGVLSSVENLFTVLSQEKMLEDTLTKLKELRENEKFLKALNRGGIPEDVLTKLRELRGNQYTTQHEFLRAIEQTIGKDQTARYRSLILEYAKHGVITENCPVINQDGIIGITVNVSKNASQILLLTDPNCNVAALIQRTRDQGIVGGQGKKDAYTMKYVSRRADVRAGQIFKLTEYALKELAKEGLPGFKLTEQAFVKLREAGIPADMLTILLDLKDQFYTTQEMFISALETTIGREQTDAYRTIILNAATTDVLAQLQALKDHQYTTEESFLSALEITIGREQVRQYRRTILRYVQEEETVVSSGLGGIFPKGLLIGTVSKVVKHDYGLFQEIEVAPSVDFSKLEEVLIIRRETSISF